jgi:hypothetical protein
LARYEIEQEDATRFLPHNPIGRVYEHYVYHGMTVHPITREPQRQLVFSGTKDECEAFVARRLAA